jgi:predicted kinase
MNPQLDILPAPLAARVHDAFTAGGSVHWQALDDAWGLAGQLASTDQERDFHPEGDVLTHSQLAGHALMHSGTLAQLSQQLARTLVAATALHDVGKIATTRIIDGRLAAPHHAREGAMLARRLLWGAGWRVLERERVCRLVRWHMRPGFVAKDLDQVAAARIACDLDLVGLAWRHLLMLAHADIGGRGPAAPPAYEHVERMQLLELWLEEQGMLDGPPRFSSEEARMRSLAGSWQPHVAAPDSERTLILLSGLPASGKTSYASSLDAQIVSLDEVRASQSGRGRQLTGRTRQEARERVQRALASSGRVCVDATHLTRQSRQAWLRLASQYDARVEIHCLEADAQELVRRNAGRTGQHRVPEHVLAKMLSHWEMPEASEAHEVRIIA